MEKITTSICKNKYSHLLKPLILVNQSVIVWMFCQLINFFVPINQVHILYVNKKRKPITQCDGKIAIYGIKQLITKMYYPLY